MIDLVVFNVGNSRYALNIENTQRIIQMLELTQIPNAHDFIEGMISYENKIVKVLNFRKLIGLAPYEDENENLKDSFSRLIFYENNSKNFAIKVDSIDDILHIDESQIKKGEEKQKNNKYIEILGSLNINDVLINIIKTLKIPS
jgi:chemotaxis signal transduction protein